VFSYRKLPFNKGAINANCSVEIDGKHYVFGNDDIWTHDGYSEQSICDKQDARLHLQRHQRLEGSRCFVAHNQKLKQIHFCYVSGDGYVNFLNSPDGCNRAAVFDYSNGTWAFDDLPMVFFADSVNLSVTQDLRHRHGNLRTSSAARISTRKTASSARSPMSACAHDLRPRDLALRVRPVRRRLDGRVRRGHQRHGSGHLEKTGIDLDDLGKDLRGYATSVRSTRRPGSTRTHAAHDVRRWARTTTSTRPDLRRSRRPTTAPSCTSSTTKRGPVTSRSR
jgi:hypothetical protein